MKSPAVTHDLIWSYDLGVLPHMSLYADELYRIFRRRNHALCARFPNVSDPTIVGKLLHIENLGGWRIANTAPFV